MTTTGLDTLTLAELDVTRASFWNGTAAISVDFTSRNSFSRYRHITSSFCAVEVKDLEEGERQVRAKVQYWLYKVTKLQRPRSIPSISHNSLPYWRAHGLNTSLCHRLPKEWQCAKVSEEIKLLVFHWIDKVRKFMHLTGGFLSHIF